MAVAAGDEEHEVTLAQVIHVNGFTVLFKHFG